MKVCTKCKEVLPVESFHKCCGAKDGLAANCKLCRAKAYDKVYALRAKSITEQNRRSKKISRSKGKDWRGVWGRKYPEKVKAQRLAQKAVKKGTLSKEKCEICSDLKVEAHHPDYSKPLEVQWLCRKHHAALHREMKRNQLKKELKNVEFRV